MAVDLEKKGHVGVITMNRPGGTECAEHSHASGT